MEEDRLTSVPGPELQDGDLAHLAAAFTALTQAPPAIFMR